MNFPGPQVPFLAEINVKFFCHMFGEGTNPPVVYISEFSIFSRILPENKQKPGSLVPPFSNYVLRPESLTILKNDFLLHIQLPTFSSPSFIRAIYARVPLVVIVCFTRFTKVITNKTRNQIVWEHSFHLIQIQLTQK